MAKPLPPNAFLAESRFEWRSWLEANHERGDGVWLATYKKASGKPYLPYGDAVEEALCFGWIDSKPRKLDDQRTMLWFAPRKPGSGWSKPNKERVERLIDTGAMNAAGLRKVEIAKADGSWSSLDAIEALEIPSDLGEALDAFPAARNHFEAFPRSAKRGTLEWIASAKRPETRARRIEETARLAEDNERANQWRRP